MSHYGNNASSIKAILKDIAQGNFSPLDLLSGRTLAEKLTELVLDGVPKGPTKVTDSLKHLLTDLNAIDVNHVRVVVFGGGTGLSTIIGGDSCSVGWTADPFHGLKAVFPQTRAIVCVMDDGGSTGELLKDLPLIGLGDLRHVLLSSIQVTRLRDLYHLDALQATQIITSLFVLFNYRYKHHCPATIEDLLVDVSPDLDRLPGPLASGIVNLLRRLFADSRLTPSLSRPHCLGNLLVTSAIYCHHKGGDTVPAPEAVRNGLLVLTELLGVPPDAVLPCTTTPSHLKMSYTNGVQVTGESKSSLARRGYPVDQVCIDFVQNPPYVFPEVLDAIGQADIIVFAPGSLYTSIVPIMQVPGLAEAVRNNQNALKVLVANLWVQAGETDSAMDDPNRRFYVSDLLKAYQRNIPGGVDGLFKQILLLNMQDIPGSILQRYAVEGKIPIYQDRERVWKMGFLPLEAGIFSPEGLADRWVKHDPAALALTLKTLWAVRDFNVDDHPPGDLEKLPPGGEPINIKGVVAPACERFALIRARLDALQVDESDMIADILWRHPDIPAAHLDYIRGLRFVERRDWRRCQEWDNIYSFFNPDDSFLNIREDMRHDKQFEVAFLVALGQSLLGNYVAEKFITPLKIEGDNLGKIYLIKLRPETERICLFSDAQLREYLVLSRMCPSKVNNVFTRLLNGDEGFTPPGLLFGLTYAWYIDNRFVSHVEYKMAIARAEMSDAVPEQIKIFKRRWAFVNFFRKVVFGI